MDIDQRHGHFLTMLASCWDDARIAGLPLRVVLFDGTAIEGLPSTSAQRPDPGEGEVDATGVAQHLELGGVLFDPTRVKSYTVVLTPAA